MTGPSLTEPQNVARGAAVESERATLAGEAEAGLVTHGQRRINLLWERTQAFIAIEVVTVTLLVVLALVIGPPVFGDTTEGARNAAVAGMVLLSNLTGIVIGTYFQRTNHQKVGGVEAGDVGR